MYPIKVNEYEKTTISPAQSKGKSFSDNDYRPVVPGCAGCAMAHPDFVRLVNPISTRRSRLHAIWSYKKRSYKKH